MNLKNYLKESYQIKGTRGEIQVHLAYRGFTGAATEKFNPHLPYEEKGGPSESPIKVKFPDPTGDREMHPNRLRTPLRQKAPWLSTAPAIWSTQAAWTYEMNFIFTWDWCGGQFKSTFGQWSGGGPVGK